MASFLSHNTQTKYLSTVVNEPMETMIRVNELPSPLHHAKFLNRKLMEYEIKLYIMNSVVEDGCDVCERLSFCTLRRIINVALIDCDWRQFPEFFD